MSALESATHALAARLCEAGALVGPVVRVQGDTGWIGLSDRWLVRFLDDVFTRD